MYVSFSETIAVGDTGVEVLQLTELITILLEELSAVAVTIHVGQAPVEREVQRMMIGILSTYAETQTEIITLDFSQVHLAVAEELCGIVFNCIPVKLKLLLSVHTDGKVRTEVGKDAQIVQHIVTITHVQRDLDIARTELHCARIFVGQTGSDIHLGTLHGVIDTQVDKHAIARGQHVLATNTQIETCLGVGQTIKSGIGMAEITDVHAEKSLYGKTRLWYVFQSLGAAGTHDGCQSKSKNLLHNPYY